MKLHPSRRLLFRCDFRRRKLDELVDFNEIYGKGIKTATEAEPIKKTRRAGAKKKVVTDAIEEVAEVKAEETPEVKPEA